MQCCTQYSLGSLYSCSLLEFMYTRVNPFDGNTHIRNDQSFEENLQVCKKALIHHLHRIVKAIQHFCLQVNNCYIHSQSKGTKTAPVYSGGGRMVKRRCIKVWRWEMETHIGFLRFQRKDNSELKRQVEKSNESWLSMKNVTSNYLQFLLT